MSAGPRYPRKTLVWTALASVLATIAIVLLTVNLQSSEKKVQQTVERLYPASDPQFVHTMGTLLGPPVLEGNRYRALVNGGEIFPAMIAAIRGAKESVNFETYIYWSGPTGQAFAAALAERAKAGVKVQVLLDWVGSAKMNPALISTMEVAGVKVLRYHPPSWTQLGRLNNRTHRKLLVVDGRIGFTGGVGIAEQWEGHAEDPAHWRDTHFEIEGPAVAQMQAVFMDNWIKTAGAVLHGPEFFPNLAPVAGVGGGAGRAQVFSSSPSGGSASMELMYLLSITAATKTIRLSASYFVPNDLALKTLVDAVKRGVKLQIIVPGPHTDSDTVAFASKARWGELLLAGGEIYEYQPTMYHCKVMIVDDLMVSVGSTNFDDRSFRLNDEANLNIYDEGFAKEQAAQFEADLAKSRRVTLAEWLDRPLLDKAKERLASLLRAQL